MRHIKSVVILGLLAVLTPMSVRAADLTIDRATTYQTIEGFGFFGAADVWWSSASAVLDQAWTDKVIDDLGISMWRNEYYSEATVQDATWDKTRPVVQAMVDTAKKRGVKLKILLTVWSPPAAIKCLSDDKNLTCNSNPPTRPKDTKGGNILDPAMRADLATWLIAGLQMYKDLGAEVYALSFQNEPYFQEPYNACVYAQDNYSATLAAVGPSVKAAFPNVKLFGAENMLGIECGKSPGTAFDPWFYTGNIMNVPAALSALDAFAVHGYVDGVSATATSKLASMWTSMRTATAKTGKALWMTETSGYFHTWPGTADKPGPLDLGQAIYAALAYGNVSAWTYWQGSEKEGFTEYSLMAGASKLGKNYHVSKQFFRFIRPGAQRVDCKSGDPDVMAVAFSNPSTNAFTVVVLNTGSSSKTLTLAGTGLPAEYQAFRTSATEDAAALGKIAADAISLPASSITTLVNGSYRESDPGTGGSGGSSGSAGASGTSRADAGPDAGGAGGRSGTGGRSSGGGTGGATSGSGKAGTTATGGRTAVGGTTVGTTAATTGQGGAGGSKLPDAGISIGGTAASNPPSGAGGSPGALADASPISPAPDASVAAKSDSSGCGCQLGGSGPATSAIWLLAFVGLVVAFARSGRKPSRS